MVAIKGHFDGKVFVPDEPVALPQGQRVTVHVDESQATVPPANPPSSLRWMSENAIDDPALPSDLSANLDHYLYGAPKNKP